MQPIVNKKLLQRTRFAAPVADAAAQASPQTTEVACQTDFTPAAIGEESDELHIVEMYVAHAGQIWNVPMTDEPVVRSQDTLQSVLMHWDEHLDEAKFPGDPPEILWSLFITFRAADYDDGGKDVACSSPMNLMENAYVILFIEEDTFHMALARTQSEFQALMAGQRKMATPCTYDDDSDEEARWKFAKWASPLQHELLGW
jgi:hypothetical protein